MISTPHHARPFARELVRARLARGMSQRQLADRAYCDRTYISRLESGQRVPSLDLVDRLAAAMRLSPRDADRLRLAAGYAPREPETLAVLLVHLGVIAAA